MGCILGKIGDITAPKVKVKVGGLIANGAEVTAILDGTGAERTACGLNTLNILRIDPGNLCNSSTCLHAADRHELSLLY